MPDSLPDPFKPEDILKVRDLFRRTGALHDLQIFNLKVWPQLVFPMAKAIKIGIDFKEREVTYDLTIPWYKFVGDLRTRGEGLNESIHYLLGGDYRLCVRSKGKVIFVGKRAEAVDAREYTGTDFEAGRIVPTTPWNFQKKS
jgi:hypothetical protein